MPRALSLAFIAGLVLAVAACGGGSKASAPPPSEPQPTPEGRLEGAEQTDVSAPVSPEPESTLEAIQADARRTPVSDDVRAYAASLCGPVHHFYANAADLIRELDQITPESEDFSGFEEALGIFRELKGPLASLSDDLEDVDPPGGLRSYHESLVRELEYAQEIFGAVDDEGFLGALMLATPPATVAEPDGLEAALIQECGDELGDFIEEFGDNFFELDDEG
jgi:hypothetical protein